MKLSIIIVNYQSRAYLEKCLASVFEKIDPEIAFEVIVVNNGKKEELLGLEVVFPTIKTVQNQKNSGFGEANNLGVLSAQGEILFFLNPDTELISAGMGEVLDEFTKNQDLGALGSKLISPEGRVQKWIAGAEINLWGIIKNNLGIIADEKYWKSEQKKAVFWVAGTALFVRRDIFLRLGGFDENFFLYFEDADLCRRIIALGKKIIYFPKFSILHYGGKSFLTKRSQKKSYYSSQDYYFKKHRGFFEFLLLRFLRLFSF